MFTSPVLSNFNEAALTDISNTRGIELAKRRPSKQNYIDAISEEVNLLGIKQFLSLLKVIDLEELTKNMSEETLTSNGNNPKTKSVLTKRLFEAFRDDGIVRYLTDADLKVKALTDLLERMEVEPTSKKPEDLVKQIQTEIHFLGLSSFFSNFNIKQLQSYAKDLGLTVESSAKTTLLRSILTMSDWKSADHPRPPRKPKEVVEMKDDDENGETNPNDETVDWSVSDEGNDEEFEGKEEIEDISMSEGEDDDQENIMEDDPMSPPKKNKRAAASRRNH